MDPEARDDNLRLLLVRDEFQFIAKGLGTAKQDLRIAVGSLLALASAAFVAGILLPPDFDSLVVVIFLLLIILFLEPLGRAVGDLLKFRRYARDLGGMLKRYGRDVETVAAACACRDPSIIRVFRRGLDQLDQR